MTSDSGISMRLHGRLRWQASKSLKCSRSTGHRSALQRDFGCFRDVEEGKISYEMTSTRSLSLRFGECRRFQSPTSDESTANSPCFHGCSCISCLCPQLHRHSLLSATFDGSNGRLKQNAAVLRRHSSISLAAMTVEERLFLEVRLRFCTISKNDGFREKVTV